MRIRRHIPAAASLALLSACATAPQTSRGPSPGTGAMSDTLKVCAGMGVSNAPAARSNGHIVDYDPGTVVAGVRLARAPVSACLSSGFGPRRGGAGSFHKGVDLFTRTPRQIHAGGAGVVESVDTLRGYGRTVLIRHNRRVKTRYAHLSSYARGLKQGDQVRQGDIIGHTGDSGNATAVHLHYEILVDGRPRNPLSVGGSTGS